MGKCEVVWLSGLYRLADAIRERFFGETVTFSRNVFIPLVNLCRNRCAYCGFRKNPWDNDAKLLLPEEVKLLLRKGKDAGCSEALFTFGERPEEKYPSIRDKLNRLGYESTLDYLYDMCSEALKLGLLPHSNPGVLHKKEVKMLKEVNASMGLMLENVSDRLCMDGGPHACSPGKKPELRLKTLAYAGECKVPFTTGILVGIGETLDEIVASLYAIKQIHERYGHIQEVIIQNFVPKPGTPMENHPPPTLNYYSTVVALARVILPGDVSVQVPPNLNLGNIGFLLSIGANDLGGISPITPDYINPSEAWPEIEEVKCLVSEMGRFLRERLPVYPKYLKEDDFLSEKVAEVARILSDENGFRRSTS